MQFHRLPKVLEKLEVSRSFLYGEIAAGRFPRPTKIGRRAIAWPAHVIEQWIADRAAESERAG